MTYHNKESLLEQLKNEPQAQRFLYVYEEYVDVLDKEGIISLYHKYDVDIYELIFKTIIQISQAKKLSPEEIVKKQTDFLNKKIKMAKEAESFSKQDIVPLIEELINNSKDAYNTRTNNKISSNNNIEAYNLSLCSELNMKVLYMLDNIDAAIQEAKQRILLGTNKESIAKRIYAEIKNNLSTINDDINNEVTTEKKEVLDTIKDYTNDYTIKVNGHNLYALLNNLSKKDRLLIKHLLITMATKDYFAEKRLPNEGEVIDGKDFLLLALNFNPEEVLRNVNKETLAHSNDNIESRYLETIIQLDDNYHLAFATATSIVLDYRIREINKELKATNYIYTKEEQEILKDLDEETKEFISFIKNSIINSNLIRIGNKKLLNSIKKYVKNLNEIKDYSDIEKLNACFQQWLNSIDISKLTEEEFVVLDELDSKFLYSKLPLASKVIYKRRETAKRLAELIRENPEFLDAETVKKFGKVRIKAADIFAADANVDDSSIIESLSISKDAYKYSKEMIDKYNFKGLVFKPLKKIERDYIYSIKGNNKESIKGINQYDEADNFILNRNIWISNVKDTATKKELKEFADKLAEMKVNESMLPISEEEAFCNYKVLKQTGIDFNFDLIMYSQIENTLKIISKCEEDNKMFYPELIVMNYFNKDYSDFFSFYLRIRDYKRKHNNEPISPAIIRSYFFSQKEYEKFIKREEEKESNKRQEFIKNFIKDYKDSGGDPSDLYSELDTILQEMDSQNYKEEPIKK